MCGEAMAKGVEMAGLAVGGWAARGGVGVYGSILRRGWDEGEGSGG